MSKVTVKYLVGKEIIEEEFEWKDYEVKEDKDFFIICNKRAERNYPEKYFINKRAVIALNTRDLSK